MERARLSAARLKKHWTLEEAAAELGVDRSTLLRWEKGKTTPQPMHVRKLCEIYGLTAQELGLEDDPGEVQSTIALDERDADALASFRKQDLTLRLLRIVWSWSYHARYRDLQQLILSELEDNRMEYENINRRDALRRLALLPIEMCGLSALRAVLSHPIEEILKQCAAGITACWCLRKGKELAFADSAVSNYIPTLKVIAQQGTTSHRASAADLLAQSYLLKSTTARHLDSSKEAASYARNAETYAEIAGHTLLRILALRTQAAAYQYAHQWEQALAATIKAKYLLEETEKKAPLPPIVHSYVYAGLATYQAYHGKKQDALRSLEKAHATFFAQSDNTAMPIWVDHNLGNLLSNDGQAHLHLNLYKQAAVSFAQIHESTAGETAIFASSRMASFINQVMAEVSRDDQPRDMERCVECWKKGLEGAKILQSTLLLGQALQAYQAMCAAWPGERRIKELRDLIIHW